MQATVTIGQKLYEPDPRRSSVWEYEVVSIGRKWIQLKPDGRCSFDLMRDCGGYSPKKLYTSIEVYESERRLEAAWTDFRRDVSYARRPEGLTVEGINQMREKLGLKVFEG